MEAFPEIIWMCWAKSQGRSGLSAVDNVFNDHPRLVPSFIQIQ